MFLFVVVFSKDIQEPAGILHWQGCPQCKDKKAGSDYSHSNKIITDQTLLQVVAFACNNFVNNNSKLNL